MKGNIEDYIPAGRDNKISRQSLVQCTGLSDRVVRAYISEARARGQAIVGDPEGGYYIAETDADMRILLGELMSRMKKLYSCYKAVEKGLAS